MPKLEKKLLQSSNFLQYLHIICAIYNLGYSIMIEYSPYKRGNQRKIKHSYRKQKENGRVQCGTSFGDCNTHCTTHKDKDEKQ